MTDKRKHRYEPLAWAIVLSLVVTVIWSIYKTVGKLTEPCPTVECPQYVPFATVEDMRQLQFELVECQRDLDEIQP